MKASEIFNLQDRAAPRNVQQFEKHFDWCNHAIELMLDTHEFLANDPEMIAYKESMSHSDSSAFKAMNVTVNLAYDAVGSLISALRLMEYGVLADAWSLIRGAFESTCYAEFFALNSDKVKDYMQIAETIKSDHSADIRKEIRNTKLQINKVVSFLKKHDGEDRQRFYTRLSNFGVHVSPVRAGLRIKLDEPEARAYLSIGHRKLIQCIADFAATARYALGVPFDTWPDLMQKKPLLSSRYRSLEEDYKVIFDPS